MSSRRLHVGYYTVTEEREVTQYYECAAWHQTIRVAPGRYAVYAYPRGNDIGHTLYVPVSGPIASACFVSRIGASYGRDRGPETVGQTAEGSIHLNPYARIGEEDPNLELDPSVVKRHVFDTSSGGQMVSYRLA